MGSNYPHVCSTCGHSTALYRIDKEGRKTFSRLICHCGKRVFRTYTCDRWQKRGYSESEMVQIINKAEKRLDEYENGEYPGWRNPIPFMRNYRNTKEENNGIE